MAQLTTQDFTTLVRNQVTAIQAGSSALLDLTVGSVLRAIVEANAVVVLWLQGLILQLLATTRASTSAGSDLDSWVADYGVTRTAAVAAKGVVTFSRFTPTAQAVVPIGTVVQTGDGTQQFTVTIDITNGAYNAGLGGYVMAPATASVSVPVTAVTPGSGANAQIVGISALTSAMPGIDTVTNAAAVTTGVDAETDTALRIRFVNYIASLARATKAAIGFAIQSVQSGVTYTLVEDLNPDTSVHLGYFYVVVDDGSGAPSGTFLSTVYNAIDQVRAVGMTFSVFAPTLVTVSVAMTATTAAGYDHTATVLLVKNAVTSYVNTLPLGTSLAYSRVIQVAYDASPGVTNVTATLLNGATADITATASQVIKVSTVTVT